MTVLHAAVAANPLDPKSLLGAFGLIGVLVIVFAETGLLIGFFLPGDSLLFLAGVAASPFAERLVGLHLPLSTLLVGAPVCAIAGAQLGHLLGARWGRRLFDRPDSRLFKRAYVERAEHSFARFGPAKAVILARFIPVVRTFLNPVAGIVGMPARRFAIYNVLGAVLWADGVVLAGYKLADVIPAAVLDRYLLPAVALVVAVSLAPVVVEFLRERRRVSAP
ncbi:membrane protein [Longispora fulva]|uniref:Membrane-associated protein n=1 Tax=Longispora fulva TaxID=619741 RepID=A0A8J7GEX3_9ACTN|nr:DedA family protein [Longispora fulva]MBG6136481.1 membrane-associated protein [Longispora fulva]GIG59650.1 membrane protein [Longispora fulva]